MSTKPKDGSAEQFELFLPYLADLPLRDQREMMERPFFSVETLLISIIRPPFSDNA